MNSSVQQPMIVKYVESLHNGIQSQALSRYAIGYPKADSRSSRCSFITRPTTCNAS